MAKHQAAGRSSGSDGELEALGRLEGTWEQFGEIQGSAAERRAREIIDANLYMVLGTADPSGRPWTSPVYFAHLDYREFIWVSVPDVRHSRNIASRPDVSAVIFDSTAEIGTGKGVYISAVAHTLTGSDAESGIAVYSDRSLSHGGNPWTVEDVQTPAFLRLFGATVIDLYVLGDDDRRVPVEL